jgi:hypothetical protein
MSSPTVSIPYTPLLTEQRSLVAARHSNKQPFNCSAATIGAARKSMNICGLEEFTVKQKYATVDKIWYRRLF